MAIKRESWLYLALFSKFCFHENPRESKRLCQDTYKISLTCWTIPHAITLETMKIYAGLMVCECFHIHYLILISILWKTCRANIITPIQQIKILHSEGVTFKVTQLIHAWAEKEAQSPEAGLVLSPLHQAASWEAFGSSLSVPNLLLKMATLLSALVMPDQREEITVTAQSLWRPPAPRRTQVGAGGAINRGKSPLPTAT